MHAWFDRLDRLPAALYSLRQNSQRLSILRAYALLRRHGIDVQLDLTKLPDAARISPWFVKAAKIGADQLLFSSLYTFTFFLAVGGMNGAAEKWAAESTVHELEAVHSRVAARFPPPSSEAAVPASSKEEEEAKRQLRGWLVARLTSGGGGDSGGAAAEEQAAVAQRLLSLLEAEQREAAQSSHTWGQVWRESWNHMTDVYWTTYAADCLVWWVRGGGGGGWRGVLGGWWWLTRPFSHSPGRPCSTSTFRTSPCGSSPCL